jgi:hypothetical protein
VAQSRAWGRFMGHAPPFLTLWETMDPTDPVPEPAQARWFRSLEQQINDDYITLHKAALQDPQSAGHGGEGTWVNILSHWLPPAYEVVTRKYIVPEIGDDEFETDIIVLNPSYPTRLRRNARILAGGVAAAFSVKLTLDSAGIRDGVKRAIALRRALKPRHGTPRDEVIPPFPVGILSHSHIWKKPTSRPIDNIIGHLASLDRELVRHPRESLDYLCVSDLATWTTARSIYIPPSFLKDNAAATEEQLHDGASCTMTYPVITDKTFNALASLIGLLFVRLSYFDSTLRPMADNLRLTGTLGGGGSLARLWDLSSVYSAGARTLLPYSKGNNWGPAIY